MIFLNLYKAHGHMPFALNKKVMQSWLLKKELLLAVPGAGVVIFCATEANLLITTTNGRRLG